MKRRKIRKGSILMTLGLGLMAAALGLAGYNIWDESRAGETAQNDVTVLVETIKALPVPEVEPVMPVYEMEPEMELPEVELDGHGYIGVLRIPSLGLELPVMSRWSYPKLRLAPCRYIGSPYTDNLVIAAHNYRTHFGGLKNLKGGESVTFTDMAGNEFDYQVALVDILTPRSVEEMTSGQWPLSLFTCTIGGKYRVTVRCEYPES